MRLTETVPIVLACCVAAIPLPSLAADGADALTRVRNLRQRGEFREARALETALADQRLEFPDATRRQLRHELILLDRVSQEFSLTRDELFRRLDQSLTNLTRDEFARWLVEGRFESRRIDGVDRFASASVGNLYWRYPELEPRRREPRNRDAFWRSLLQNARRIRASAARERQPFVLPHPFRVAMAVTVNADAVPAGQTVRAWLPVPRTYPFQDGFTLRRSSSPPKHIADSKSPIRSVCFEQAAVAGQPTRFEIDYEYHRRAICFALRPDEVQPINHRDPLLQPFLREAPHVVFTEAIKSLAARIAGPETNSLRLARAFYDWIGANVRYSFTPEYSTIDNIPEYVLAHRFGDCGAQALLFITLCRRAGIPARWQSGWFTFPGGKNIHDWSEVYLPPWGWVPVDVEVGNSVQRYGTGLMPDERRELHEFYFGGLDQYRMAANSDHGQQLTPAKRDFRSDDVDFQRGEVESGERNIYFNCFSYELQAKTAASR